MEIGNNGSYGAAASALHPHLANGRDDEPQTAIGGVSWGAVLAGATVAAAASMALLALGTGLGLSAISPWAQKGLQASTFGVSSIVWVTVTQLCASALGGYLAGRLRSRWLAVHTDEVYFRDTAHGLLSWAVASLITAALLWSVASSAIEGTAKTTVNAATSAMDVGVATLSTSQETGSEPASLARRSNEPLAYLVDALFRREPAPSGMPPEAAPTDAARVPVSEVSRIFTNGVGAGALAPQDTRYLGQLVAQRTGLAQADAERRVTDTYAALQAYSNDAKTATAVAAEKARKLGIEVSLWLFIALLSGAFIACYTAMLGGRERDAQ